MGGIPLGINNKSLKEAIRNRPKRGMGVEFSSFVIPLQCESIKEDENYNQEKFHGRTLTENFNKEKVS